MSSLPHRIVTSNGDPAISAVSTSDSIHSTTCGYDRLERQPCPALKFFDCHPRLPLTPDFKLRHNPAVRFCLLLYIIPQSISQGNHPSFRSPHSSDSCPPSGAMWPKVALGQGLASGRGLGHARSSTSWDTNSDPARRGIAGDVFFVSFSPANSPKASRALRQTIRREWRLMACTHLSLNDLACMLNPIITGEVPLPS